MSSAKYNKHKNQANTQKLIKKIIIITKIYKLKAKV